MAASPDDASFCVGDVTGDLKVFAIHSLLESSEPLTVLPRALGKAGGWVAAAVYSLDGERLYVLRADSSISVHDARSKTLDQLRTLEFRGGKTSRSPYLLRLCCSPPSSRGELLVACGGGVFSNSNSDADRIVRVWQLVDEDAQELHTFRFETAVDAVALRRDGTKMAVGTRAGTVHIYNTTNWDMIVELLVGKQEGDGGGSDEVKSMNFNPTGTQLVIGRASTFFTVIDVDSTAEICQFHHPQSTGEFAEFLNDHVLFIGGGASGYFATHLTPAPQPVTRSTVTIQGHTITGASNTATQVALAAASRVEVRNIDSGEIIFEKNFEADIFCHYYHKSAVLLRPDGAQLACVIEASSVSVFTLEGQLQFECGPWAGAKVMEMTWSPDSRWLVICGKLGAAVHETQTGTEVLRLPGDNIMAVQFDPSSSFLATGGVDSQVTVWQVGDETSWHKKYSFPKESGHIYSICFDSAARRVAFWVYDNDGTCVVAQIDDNGSSLRFPHLNAQAGVSFSPDDQLLLCKPSPWFARAAPGMQHLRLLSVDGGKQELITSLGCLHAMALPVDGNLIGSSVNFVQLSTSESPQHQQLLFSGAAGSQFSIMDMDLIKLAVEDGAWTQQQLVYISKHHPELVSALTCSHPRVANIRGFSAETVFPDSSQRGDTIFHHFAREREESIVKTWLQNGVNVTPQLNSNAETAVTVAVEVYNSRIARILWKALSGNLNRITASAVAAELNLLARSSPELVHQFMQDVEGAVLQTLKTFRTQMSRPMEVRGYSAPVLPKSEIVGGIPELWKGVLPSDRQDELVSSKVVLLPGLLGNSMSSPFHAIVENCDSLVFNSRLLELVVQCKWEENVFPKWRLMASLYVFAVLVASSAMVCSAVQPVQSGNSTWLIVTDALHATTALAETIAVLKECNQLTHGGGRRYLTNPWNYPNVVSSSCLLAGVFCYFRGIKGSHSGTHAVGAFGVAAKWFGLIDYLRAFEYTGSLIRMIIVIVQDMGHLLIVLGILLLGTMLFQVIESPHSGAFSVTEGAFGIFSPLITILMTLTGQQNFDPSDYQSWNAVLMQLLFIFVVIIVMLNLLIAIMADSYEKVKENERVEALRERAGIIVDMELKHPSWHVWHDYMHIVEASSLEDASTEATEWAGITGRVKELLRMQSTHLVAVIDGKMKSIAQKQDALELNQAQMMATLRKLENASLSGPKYQTQRD